MSHRELLQCGTEGLERWRLVWAVTIQGGFPGEMGSHLVRLDLERPRRMESGREVVQEQRYRGNG